MSDTRLEILDIYSHLISSFKQTMRYSDYVIPIYRWRNVVSNLPKVKVMLNIIASVSVLPRYNWRCCYLIFWRESLQQRQVLHPFFDTLLFKYKFLWEYCTAFYLFPFSPSSPYIPPFFSVNTKSDLDEGPRVNASTKISSGWLVP